MLIRMLGGAERVFGIHTAPDLEVGQIGVKPGINNASVDHFVIRVEGKSSNTHTHRMRKIHSAVEDILQIRSCFLFIDINQ